MQVITTKKVVGNAPTTQYVDKKIFKKTCTNLR